MFVLGIETSCDETAAAVVEIDECDRLRMCTNVIHSQVAVHQQFGGVVPEIASREHVQRIDEVIKKAVEGVGYPKLSGIAVTSGPGLVGCLLVGMQAAKGLAMRLEIPMLGVNHLEGHLSACRLGDVDIVYPHVALVVSGGHTQLYHVKAFGVYEMLGGTLDDAAGEAFDKIAKVLDLGYPGGVAIQNRAEGGDRCAYDLPRALRQRKNFDFSFSGLKTSAATAIQKRPELKSDAHIADFCASVQEAIAEVLVKKTLRVARHLGVKNVVLAGGVAANARLRVLMDEGCAEKGMTCFKPERVLCTDNGAMIAAAGAIRIKAGESSPFSLSPRSRWPLAHRAESLRGPG